jgi:hypothetical protein
MLADMTARAKAGQFDTRRDEVGQRPPQGPQVGGGNQDFIDNRDPNRQYTQDRVDYIDPATGERTSRTRGVVPAPGSRFVPANQAGMYGQRSEIEGRNAAQNQFTQGRLMGAPVNQGPIPGGNMQIPNLSKEEIENLNNPNAYFKGKDQGFLQFASPSDIQLRYNDIPQAQKDELFARYQPSPIPMQGAMASQYQNPQGQQAAMAAYNNFLQQGIQNSNTLNQGAMASFANTQPGMQVPQVPQAGAQVPQAGAQIPQPTIAKPQRPSMVTQQRRPLPAPRKFSTLRNTPARFG